MNELDTEMSLDTQLEESKSRLGQALQRLEQAVAARLDQGDDSEEIERLSQALAAADQRNQMLKGQSQRVAQSLDRTIERLTSILED